MSKNNNPRQLILVHYAFTRDAQRNPMTKVMYTWNFRRDTSKAWHHHEEIIEAVNTELHIWFYGRKEMSAALNAIAEIKKSVLENRFYESVIW